MTLSVAERQLRADEARRVLAEHHWSINAAAASLGLTPSAFSHRVKRSGNSLQAIIAEGKATAQTPAHPVTPDVLAEITKLQMDLGLLGMEVLRLQAALDRERAITARLAGMLDALAPPGRLSHGEDPDCLEVPA